MNEDLLKRIKNKLKSEFYSMNDEWLKDCVEFYVDQHTNPSNEEILQFVKVQWQLSDLREINNENGSLPRNLSQQKFVVLHEKYVLQVEQMYDISISKYKQMQQIRDVHISEVDPSEAEKLDKWEPPKKRMMQLRLTDGIQDIIGIEYNYVSKFNETWLPGYKIIIIGPVKCRRGVLLLEEKTVKGIGGEVENLLIPNALENILARALNLQENPDPYNDNQSKQNNVERKKKSQMDVDPFEEDFDINLDEVSEIEDLQNKNQKQSNASTLKTEITVETTSNIIQRKGTSENFNDIVENKKTTENCFETMDDCNFTGDEFFDNDDCILEMVDEETLIESQAQNNIIAPFRSLPKEGGDDIIVINDEDDVFTHLTHDNLSSNKKTHCSTFVTTSTNQSSSNMSNLKMYTNRKGSLQTTTGKKRMAIALSPEAVTLKKGKIDRKITDFAKPITPPEPHKICDFISEINKQVILEKVCKQIRGRVEVLGKLGKKDSLWILEATIIDGTGKIDVSFSNEVLENLLGFTVQEFSVKKKQKKNPEIEHELRMSFRSAEQMIKTLDALLDLELNVNSKPKVKKITKLTQQQKEQIDKGLNNFLKKVNT